MFQDIINIVIISISMHEISKFAYIIWPPISVSKSMRIIVRDNIRYYHIINLEATFKCATRIILGGIIQRLLGKRGR